MVIDVEQVQQDRRQGAMLDVRSRCAELIRRFCDLQKFAIDIAPLLPAVTDDGGDVDEAQMFFSSESSKKAINIILLTHFSRCGDEKLASVFAKVNAQIAMLSTR